MSGFSQWFKGLRGKLVLILAIAMIALVSLMAVSYKSLHSVIGSMENIADHRLPTVLAVGEMKSSTNAIARYMWSAYVEKTADARKPRIEELRKAIREFEQGINDWKSVPNHGKNGEIFDRVEKAYKELAPNVLSVISELEKGTAVANEDAYFLITRDIRPFMKTVTEGLAEIENNVRQSVKTESAEASAGGKSAVNWLLIIGSISIIVTFILGFFVAASLASALTLVTKLIHDSSTQVAKASAQVSVSSQQLAATSSEQASAVEETSASLEEMSGMVENNVRNAEQGLQGVNKVIANTQEGNESMMNLKQSMTDILDSNKKIEKLVKVIEEIGDKTAIIDEIVFQTKLLSFNASVEAERAGEHGRGFAVVAQEVGNLAQMSGKAALEISTIVKASTKEAQEIATENREKVEKGGSLVENTAKILAGIEQNAKGVLSGATHIAASSKEQAAGIKQIASAMDNINKATQETASTSEESAGAGEELSSQAKNLDSLVLRLTSIVTGETGTNETNAGYEQSGQHSEEHQEDHSFDEPVAESTEGEEAELVAA